MSLRPLIAGFTPSVLLAASGLLCCSIGGDDDDEGCEVNFADPSPTPYGGLIDAPICYAGWGTIATVGTSQIGDFYALVAPLASWEYGGQVALTADELGPFALLYHDVDYSTWRVGLFAMSTAGSFTITSFETENDPYGQYSGVLRLGPTAVDDPTPNAFFVVSTDGTPTSTTTGGVGSLSGFFNDQQSLEQEEGLYYGEGTVSVAVGTTSLTIGSAEPDGYAFVYCDEIDVLELPASSRDALLQLPFRAMSRRAGGAGRAVDPL